MAAYEPSAVDHIPGAPRRMARRLWRAVRMGVRRHRQRRALAKMERWQLDDLGLSREDADREARRLPWDGAAQDQTISVLFNGTRARRRRRPGAATLQATECERTSPAATPDL
jgi:uncharacterized protein YjiS (DUF1127 family)